MQTPLDCPWIHCTTAFVNLGLRIPAAVNDALAITNPITE